MNYLKSLPTKNAEGVTVLAMESRARGPFNQRALVRQ